MQLPGASAPVSRDGRRESARARVVATRKPIPGPAKPAHPPKRRAIC